MSDWMTIRVVLTGSVDRPLPNPPGRVMLAHADHTFAELAEAIDIAFARWDLSCLHEFAVEGHRLMSSAGEPLDDDVEDSDEIALGEVGLRLGSRFLYTFDLGEGWAHECVVDEVDVDPEETAGEEPGQPVPVFGWGTIPDQYGRETEEDDTGESGTDALAAWTDVDSQDLEEVSWSDGDSSAWEVVAEALQGVDRPRDDVALAAAARLLRENEDVDDWPYDALWAAAGLDVGELPEDDEDLWLAVAAGIVDPGEGLPVPDDVERAWSSLEPADWAGAVIELVRAGTAEPADPESLLRLIADCPEVEEQDLSDSEEQLLLAGLDTVTTLLAAIGALDEGSRLTPLGRWGLPRALERSWAGA